MTFKEKKKGKKRNILDFHSSKTIGHRGVLLHLWLLRPEGIAREWIRVDHRWRYHFSPEDHTRYCLCSPASLEPYAGSFSTNLWSIFLGWFATTQAKRLIQSFESDKEKQVKLAPSRAGESRISRFKPREVARRLGHSYIFRMITCLVQQLDLGLGLRKLLLYVDSFETVFGPTACFKSWAGHWISNKFLLLVKKTTNKIF